MQTHFAKAETIISLSVSLERWSHRPVKQAGCHLHSDRPAPPLPLGGLWFHFQFQSPVLARGWQVFLHFPQARLSCPELCLGLAWGGTDQLDLYHFEAFFSRLPGGYAPIFKLVIAPWGQEWERGMVCFLCVYSQTYIWTLTHVRHFKLQQEEVMIHNVSFVLESHNFSWVLSNRIF